MTSLEADRLAAYIVSWLETRNGNELEPALNKQTIESRRLMIAELSMILRSGGLPSNWTMPDYLQVPCPYCQAPIGSECVTSNDWGAHLARLNSIRAK